MRNRLTFQEIDWWLFSLALAIAVLGIIEIYSTTAHTALASQCRKQIYWVLLGCLLALLVSRIDYHFVLEQTPLLYGLSILALAGLLLFGPSIGGTRRWLRLAGMSLQVSEMVKLVIILAVAAYLGEKRGKHVTWADLGKVGLVVGVPAFLVALEPDLGTALTYLPVAAGGVFLVGIRPRQVLVVCMLAALALPVGWNSLRPYQRERLRTFVHPKEDTQGSGYQLAQTKIAIGSGGFWGKGIGNGTQSRLGFIPVSHSDAIFAVFAEEQGFVGTLFVLLLYFALLLRLLDRAQMAGDRAGALLLVGFASVLFFQVAVNIGMMVGLVPITGIPLPLMSRGGSSALFVFLGLGLAMSVESRRLVN